MLGAFSPGTAKKDQGPPRVCAKMKNAGSGDPAYIYKCVFQRMADLVREMKYEALVDMSLSHPFRPAKSP